jgi:hypothetical protein
VGPLACPKVNFGLIRGEEGDLLLASARFGLRWGSPVSTGARARRLRQRPVAWVRGKYRNVSYVLRDGFPMSCVKGHEERPTGGH